MSCNEPVLVTDRQVAPNVGQNQIEHQSISMRSTPDSTVNHATILQANTIVKHPLADMCWWAHHFVFGCLDGTDTMCPPSWCSVKAPPEDSCCARQRSSSLLSLLRRLLLLAGGSTQAVSAPPYTAVHGPACPGCAAANGRCTDILQAACSSAMPPCTTAAGLLCIGRCCMCGHGVGKENGTQLSSPQAYLWSAFL